MAPRHSTGNSLPCESLVPRLSASLSLSAHGVHGVRSTPPRVACRFVHMFPLRQEASGRELMLAHIFVGDFEQSAACLVRWSSAPPTSRRQSRKAVDRRIIGFALVARASLNS